MADLISAIGGQAGTSGWARAGAALGGMQNGLGQEQALARGQSQGLTITSKLLDAKKKRDEALALEQLESTLVDAGQDPSTAAIVAGASRAGNNFSQSTAGMGNLQIQGMRNTALGAATGAPGVDGAPGVAPDMDLVNRIMTVVSGKPQAISKVEGNTLINPLASPGAQQLQTTPYGQESLANQIAARRYTTDTQAATARGKASYNTAGKGAKPGDPDKARNAAFKEAASAAFREARIAGDLPAGVTQADIEYQLRTRGKWTDPDGVVRATASIDGQQLMGDEATSVSFDEAPDLVNQIGQAAPKSDAQAVARDQVRREGVNAPVSVQGDRQALEEKARPAYAKLQEARDAIAAGADPEQVRARLRKLGYTYIASKL